MFVAGIMSSNRSFLRTVISLLGFACTKLWAFSLWSVVLTLNHTEGSTQSPFWRVESSFLPGLVLALMLCLQVTLPGYTRSESYLHCVSLFIHWTSLAMNQFLIISICLGCSCNAMGISTEAFSPGFPVGCQN